jgi:hypothetical protein
VDDNLTRQENADDKTLRRPGLSAHYYTRACKLGSHSSSHHSPPRMHVHLPRMHVHCLGCTCCTATRSPVNFPLPAFCRCTHPCILPLHHPFVLDTTPPVHLSRMHHCPTAHAFASGGFVSDASLPDHPACASDYPTVRVPRIHRYPTTLHMPRIHHYPTVHVPRIRHYPTVHVPRIRHYPTCMCLGSVITRPCMCLGSVITRPCMCLGSVITRPCMCLGCTAT